MKGKKLNRVFFHEIKEITKILRKQGAHSEQPSSTMPPSSPEPARGAHSLSCCCIHWERQLHLSVGAGPGYLVQRAHWLRDEEKDDGKYFPESPPILLCI